MSRSYHNSGRIPALKSKKYHLFCTKAVRQRNKQMLRDLVPVYSIDDLGEKLYHVSKNEVYDLWTWF